MSSISTWFLRLAVSWLVVGVSLGMYMAGSHDHSLHPVHAHINLLGWVSMALFGLFYRQWPAAEDSKLARAHFFLYVPAHAVQMAALWTLMLGHPAIEPVLAIASGVVVLGILCFAAVVWRHTVA